MFEILNHPLADKILDALIIPAALGIGAFIRWWFKERRVQQRGEKVEDRKTEHEYMLEAIKNLQAVNGNLAGQLLEAGTSNVRLQQRNAELAATLDTQRQATDALALANRLATNGLLDKLRRLHDLARAIRHAGSDVYYLLKRGEEPKPGWLPALPTLDDV